MTVSLQFGPEFARTIAAAVADELERRGTLAPTTITPYMDVDQAAAYIAAKPQRLYDLVSEQKIEPQRDGRRLLFHRDALDRYLAGKNAS